MIWTESGRMIFMIGNVGCFVSSICLNVISLFLITLALQKSLQATVTTARKTYYFTFRHIQLSKHFHSDAQNIAKPNLIPRLGTLYFRENLCYLCLQF